MSMAKAKTRVVVVPRVIFEAAQRIAEKIGPDACARVEAGRIDSDLIELVAAAAFEVVPRPPARRVRGCS